VNPNSELCTFVQCIDISSLVSAVIMGHFDYVSRYLLFLFIEWFMLKKFSKGDKLFKGANIFKGKSKIVIELCTLLNTWIGQWFDSLGMPKMSRMLPESIVPSVKWFQVNI
jgi:hypothetical protein